MYPSSTSSSSAPRSGLRTPKGLLLAVGLLLVFEFGVARREWWWTCAPSSPSAAIDLVEAALVRPAQHPAIVILGSSRQRSGLVPSVMEQRLGLPTGSVLNLSVPMGTAFDGLTLYRRNRAKLSQARLLIVGIDDWDLNASLPVNDRDRRFATLKERLELFDPNHVPSLLVGWVWRTYDANGPIRSFFRDFLLGGKRRPPIADQGRMDWERTPDPERGPEELDVTADVDRFYANFRLGRERLKQLDELIGLARADGVRIMVVRVPMRDAYTATVRTRHSGAYGQVLQSMRSIRGAQVVVYESGSELGIPAHDFRDYGHLLPAGAEIMAQRLADVVRATYGELGRGPAPAHPSGDP